MNETHDPEDEFDQMLQKSLEQDYKAMKERVVPDYDGVAGEPPPWVPEEDVLRFEGYRDRLLSERGFEVSALLKFIEQYRKKYYREEHTDSVVAPGFHCPETYPNGQSVDPHCFHDEIGFLARLKWCVEMGPEKGIDGLSGKHGEIGYQTHLGSKAPRYDALRLLLEKTFHGLFQTLGHIPTNKEVINALEFYDDNDHWHKVIDDIGWDNEEVDWIDSRGREKKRNLGKFIIE
jgi:hypothetical protein